MKQIKNVTVTNSKRSKIKKKKQKEKVAQDEQSNHIQDTEGFYSLSEQALEAMEGLFFIADV